MAKNFNLQENEKLPQEKQKYKCLHKSDSGYKEGDHVANRVAWAAMEMTLNLCGGNDDYYIILIKFATFFFFFFFF